MGLIHLIFTTIGKALDFINPWSARWAKKLDARDSKREKAQNEMDEATKKGDWDAYDNARADKHNSD